VKRFSAIGLILVLTLPLFLKIAVLADYAVNYNVYANELCENLDKPELECNGKCQMMEELNEVENPVKESPVTPEILKLKEFNFVEFAERKAPIQQVLCNILYKLLKQSGVLHGFLNEVFQPPRA
jgi:hypothetical protein